jgi:cytosol alanyl aminopeptidase
VAEVQKPCPDMRRTFDAVAMSLLFSIAMCVAAQSPPPGLKLPDTVVPVAYDLQLKLDATASMYSGTVTIDVRIAAPTDLVWINATDLKVDDVHAVDVSGNGEVIGADVVAGNMDVIGLRFARPLPAGDMRLTLGFGGTFSTTNVAGLFRQKDRDDWYVLTQHEPQYARRSFPCFDEPRFRATWRIVLTVPEGQRAFSNMPIELERSSAPGWREVAFRKSPPIVSYLVAIAVGPWDVLDGGTAGRNGTPLRYIAPKGRAAEAAYAANVTPAIVERLEAYFGQPFPFPKLDSIAMPNSGFFFGAMENIGLITYDQSILLATAAEDTTNFRQEYVSTAAHEISHQWFGNLVTPAWWDDIWLNESFATWMEKKITDQVKPEWHWHFTRSELRQRAIENDRLASARRVRQPIEVRSDIISAFDAISYQKGAALLAMFEDWLGPDKFRDGVHRYMAKHAWGVATTDDFFAALAAGDEAVLPAFRAFVDRPGVPALAVDLDCSGDPTLHLRQSRFAPRGSTIDADVRWTFPACFQFGAAQGTDQCTIVRDAKTDLKLAAATCPEWVIANRRGLGYFLPVLSSRLYAKLPNAASALGPLDWVFLLSDTNILASAAAIPQPEALELAAIAMRQSDPRVYRQASAITGDVPLELTQGANRARYAKWVGAHFGPRAHELGWQSRVGEDADTQRLRRELVPLVADRGEDVVLARDARERVMRWPEDAHAVPADIRHELLWTAARTAEHDATTLYVHIVAVAKTIGDARARRDALRALGGFRTLSQQREALRLVLEDSFEPLESLQILAGALDNESARASALTWVDRNFDALVKRVTENNLQRLPFWASAACAANERALFVAVLSERMRNVDGGPRAYAKALERIDLCVAYRAAQQGPLDRWLASGGARR